MSSWRISIIGFVSTVGSMAVCGVIIGLPWMPHYWVWPATVALNIYSTSCVILALKGKVDLR